MNQASPPPANKDDIQMLMEEIGKLYDANERWKEEVKREVAEEVKRHFDVVAEDMRHDFKGAHKDKIQNHENRIRAVEQHLGLAM